MFQGRPFNFPANVAAILADVCCHGRKLPQGGRTSPMIANIICRGLDRDLWRLAKSFGCTYTRYADDLTFSTRDHSLPTALVADLPTLQQPQPGLGPDLLAVVAKHGFSVNTKKCRLRRKSERQEVTGLVVNEKVNVARTFVRNIRAILHDCDMRGIKEADTRFGNTDQKQRKRSGSPHVLEHLRGKLAYLKMVKGEDDPVYVRYALRAERLAPSHKYGLVVTGRASRDPGLVSEPLWVLVGRDEQGSNLCSGTAFCLDAFGIVSARHIFETEPGKAASSWELRNARDLQKVFPVTAYRNHSGIDLTILETSAPLYSSLRSRAEVLQAGHPVTLAGFPNWNSIADKLYAVGGHIVQTRTVGGLDYVATSLVVHPGLSGGPVLASDGSVAGVIVAGWEHALFPNSALAIRHLPDVTEAPMKNL